MKDLSARLLVAVFTFALLLLPLGLVAVAYLTMNQLSDSSGTIVFVSPHVVNVAVNQTFHVTINISDISDLYGWEFKLGYNNSLLELVNVTEGSFLNSSRDTYFVQKNMSADGYVLAGCTSLRNVAGADGNGTLATVEFRAKKLGSCTLDLYDTKLVNSAKQLIEHDEIDGTVTATGCVTVTVLFMDYHPVEGAWVKINNSTSSWFWGLTNSSGQTTKCGYLLSEGNPYRAFAYYPQSNDPFSSGVFFVDENGDADITLHGAYETTCPLIEILSPQNLTYTNNSVPLTFTIYDYSPISWIGYSLDNQANVTITGNTTLASLPDGIHEIVVYANDTFGNMGASNKIHFTVSTHDIAVTDVTVSKTIIGQGYTLYINVTVQNEGIHTETFNVTAYANTSVIQTQTTIPT
jgi:hypothetical protein